jgi:hypothetical protein
MAGVGTKLMEVVSSIHYSIILDIFYYAGFVSCETYVHVHNLLGPVDFREYGI